VISQEIIGENGKALYPQFLLVITTLKQQISLRGRGFEVFFFFSAWVFTSDRAAYTTIAFQLQLLNISIKPCSGVTAIFSIACFSYILL
jgi:hypothetical protein